jgi:CsoR family transcriptional regulator, copper-sensing transcriptional repressor
MNKGNDEITADSGEAMEKNVCPYCSGKHKDRDDKELKDLMNRLKRIEGQVRGVEGMLEAGAYCTDILTQVSAITSALNSFNKVLLANHVRTCVAENIRKGNDDVIDELVSTLQKLMR